jgi:hypothetical protein
LGRVPVPAVAEPFVAEVHGAKVQAVAEKADEKAKENNQK